MNWVHMKISCFRPRLHSKPSAPVSWAWFLGFLMMMSGVMKWMILSPVTTLGADPQAATAAARADFENETLTYNVYWKVASAGIATVRLERDPRTNQLKIIGDARSSRFVSTLYRVDDHFESLVSLKNFCSLGLTKRINEGKRHREFISEFFPEQHLARWQDRNTALPGAPVHRDQGQIPDCVQDVLSTLFYLQTQPLVLGKSIRIPVHDNGKIYNVVVEIQQRETIKTEAGTYQAIRVEPRVFGGLFKRPGRMYMWYSDDDAHRLLQLRARIPVGSITAVLAPTPAAPAVAPAHGK